MFTQASAGQEPKCTFQPYAISNPSSYVLICLILASEQWAKLRETPQDEEQIQNPQALNSRLSFRITPVSTKSAE